MSKGWIKLHRSMFDNDLWTAEPFTKGQAWIDLIGHANHKAASVWIRGIEVEVKRGQLAWSELTMGKRWRWSRGKVRRYLAMLENRGMAIQQTNKVTTILTICKYDTYQADKTTNETTCNTTGDTTDGQQTDNRRYTNKNVENGENVEKTDIKSGGQQADSEPAIFELPTNRFGTTGETYGVTESKAKEWREAYPACDVMAELKKMKAWLNDNPKKRKTKQGMAKFAGSWLSRQQDKGGSGGKSFADPLSNSPTSAELRELQKTLRGYT